MDLDEWPYPKTPLVPLAEIGARADERRDLPRLHPRLPVLPGRHDHPPGARAQHHRHRRDGRPGPATRPASRRSGCCRCPAPTTPRSARSPSSSPTATRTQDQPVAAVHPGRRVQHRPRQRALPQRPALRASPSPPRAAASGCAASSTRWSARTTSSARSATAYAQGWRQVKLYFMCGLPTETDEDVLEIADMAHDVIRAGREASGQQGHPLHRLDRRVRAQAAHAVPVGRPGRRRTPSTTGCASCATRSTSNRSLGRNVGMRYHDGEPSMIEGLLSRGDRRVGRVIERVWRDGGRFDGWSEHFSYDRWVDGRRAGPRRRRRPRLVHDPRARRRRGAALGPPRLRPGQAVALGRLAGRARRVRAGRLPVDAVLRLRRLPNLGTDIQIGPTGRTLLPLATR